MKQLNNWEHNKAVSLLQEKYNLLSIENDLVADLTNEEENENQMKLFSIMILFLQRNIRCLETIFEP
ncbi:7367_t:CDS:2 [Gigaspora rosea]|nr:7367_t:CDS:2 [Gigaspora rosea]